VKYQTNISPLKREGYQNEDYWASSSKLRERHKEGKLEISFS
jgi:hypothetical protein